MVAKDRQLDTDFFRICGLAHSAFLITEGDYFGMKKPSRTHEMI
jgi:hypothetical protein